MNYYVSTLYDLIVAQTYSLKYTICNYLKPWWRRHF